MGVLWTGLSGWWRRHSQVNVQMRRVKRILQPAYPHVFVFMISSAVFLSRFPVGSSSTFWASKSKGIIIFSLAVINIIGSLLIYFCQIVYGNNIHDYPPYACKYSMSAANSLRNPF